jgi:ankyrin repeat protein
VKLLIEAKADLDIQDKFGNTALIYGKLNFF